MTITHLRPVGNGVYTDYHPALPADDRAWERMRMAVLIVGVSVGSIAAWVWIIAWGVL